MSSNAAEDQPAAAPVRRRDITLDEARAHGARLALDAPLLTSHQQDLVSSAFAGSQHGQGAGGRDKDRRRGKGSPRAQDVAGLDQTA